MLIQTFNGISFKNRNRSYYPTLAGAKNEVLGKILHNGVTPVDIEPLIESAWPNSSIDQAKSALNTVIWRLNNTVLRKILPRTDIKIRNDRQRLLIDWQDQEPEFDFEKLKGTIDKFEKRNHSKNFLSKEDFLELVKAIETYKGDFIPRLDSNWAIIAREKYRSTYIRGCQLAIRTFAHEANFDLAISFAHRILAENTFRENTRRQLIWLYFMNGQRLDAFKLIEETVQLLKQELGVGPMPETLALIELVKGEELESDPCFDNIQNRRLATFDNLF